MAFWSNVATKQRLFKAKSQNFQIIEEQNDKYRVAGVNNVYTVDLHRHDITLSKCTCPDYRLNAYICKHIIFVYICKNGEPDAVLSSSDKDCCICLDKLFNTMILTCKKCQNEFHSECILKWRRNCPLCREPL